MAHRVTQVLVTLAALLASVVAPGCAGGSESTDGPTLPPPSPQGGSLPAPSGAVPIELRVVSNLSVGVGPENITDLWAHTDRNGKAYAYLGTFDIPSCGPDTSGVHVVDITSVAEPVKTNLIPSPPGTRVSDVMVNTLRQSPFVATCSFSRWSSASERLRNGVRAAARGLSCTMSPSR